MRYLILIPVLLLGACSNIVRENYMAVPDRDYHAWQLKEGHADAGAPSTAYRQPPIPGEERLIRLQPGQKLWQVAEENRVGLYRLIKRNDFTTKPYPGPGTQVIIPDVPHAQ